MEKTWHYPRENLAKTYLSQLGEGGHSIAIFAERRKGKTQFLLEDMKPLAEKEGISVAYIDFWEQRKDPSTCIVRGIRRAIEEIGLKGAGKWKKEIKLKLPLLEASMSQESKPMPEVAADALELLRTTKKTWLIMFDEIQHLAISKDYEDTIFTLRSFLNANTKTIKAIFTGSSQDKLNTIFRQHNAAFYNSASLVNFPELDEGFVRHVTNRFSYLSKRELSFNEMMEAFLDNHRSPYILRNLLQMMLNDGVYSVAEGLKRFDSTHNLNAEWDAIWSNLKIIDKAVLGVILNERPVYSKDTYEALSEEIGIDGITKSTIQKSIDRLRRKELLNNAGRGKWLFESSFFKEYVQSKIL